MGILANSASVSHTSSASTDTKAGYVINERITLSTSPTQAAYSWGMSKPSGSTARSVLSDTTSATPTVVPDVAGTYVFVEGTSGFILTITVVAVEMTSVSNAHRFSPATDASIPAPALGRTLYYSSTVSDLVTKDSAGVVAPVGGDLPTATIATLPTASTATGRTYLVTDEAAGPVLAFSDGVNWRRSTDNQIARTLPTKIIFNGQSNAAAGGRGTYGFTSITADLHADIKGYNGFTGALSAAVDGTANAKANAGGVGTGQGPGLGLVGTRLCRLIRDARSAQGLSTEIKTVAMAYTSQGSAYFRPDSATLAFFENGTQDATSNNYNYIKNAWTTLGVTPELWVHTQGEANAGATQAAYYADIKSTFDQSRIDYPGIKWLFVLPLGGGADQRAYGSVGFTRAWQIDDPTGTPVFTEETTDVNDPGTGDVLIWPATEVVGDQFAIGFEDPFWLLNVIVSTAGVGGTLAVKYWNGSTWTAVPGLVDASAGLTAAAGSYAVRWAKPHDWAKRSLNSTQQLFYVVFEVATTYSTNPVLTSVQMVTPYARGPSMLGVQKAVFQLAAENPGVITVVDNRDFSPHTALYGGFAGNHYTRRGYKLVADRCFAKLKGENFPTIPAAPILSHIDDLGIWSHGYSDNHSTSDGDAINWQGDLSGTSMLGIGTGPSHIASDTDFDGASTADFDRANSENCSVVGLTGLGGTGILCAHFVARIKSPTVQVQRFCELRNTAFTSRIGFNAVSQANAHSVLYDTSDQFFANPTGSADASVHAFALVIDTAVSTAFVYVDGKLYGSTTIDNSEVPDPLTWEVGALASTDHLDGRIAHLRLALGIVPTVSQLEAAALWMRTEYALSV